MNIGILGAGKIGGTLGRKWAAAGHQLAFGVRNTTNPDALALTQSLGAALTTSAKAIAFGDVIVFALPGPAMTDMIAGNAAALNGKIVIDTANKVGSAVFNSFAEFAALAPQAHAFRAFNSLGWENFAEPMFGTVQADLFYAGPAGDPLSVVERLISDVGLRPVHIGGPGQVAVVDAIASLWFALALGQKRGRHLAFKVLE